MTQLAAAVDDNDELWTLDTLPTPEAPYVEVESELVEVRSRFPSSYYTLTGETLPPRIRVRRGIAGTTKASHIQGSTLTPNYGLGSGAGAGGVTVDNLDDPPAEVTTLIAPGATIAGDEADLTGVLQFRYLGPFLVNFDTANITSANGVVAFALEANQVLLQMRCEPVTLWDAHIDNASVLALVGGANHAAGDWYEYAKWLVGSNVAPSRDANNAPEAPLRIGAVGGIVVDEVYQSTPTFRVVTTGAIRVKTADTAGAAAGAADIFALIAEPAA